MGNSAGGVWWRPTLKTLAIFVFINLFSSAFAGGVATLPFLEDFESGSLDSYWTTDSTGAGRIQVATTGYPHKGGYHLTMDAAQRGVYSLNELVLTLDLTGKSGVMLAFYHKEFRDENHGLPDGFSGSHRGDGVTVSPDGTSWHKVQGLTSQEGISADWTRYEIDLDAAAAAAGISYTDHFRIKFQQYDNYPVSTDGFAFDDIEVYQTMVDTDGDGLPDDWEVTHFDTLAQGAGGDVDGDGLDNLGEYRSGSDPAEPDSDGDGMEDGWEVQFGLDPLDAGDADADADGDGSNNLEEYLGGTNPMGTSAALPFREDFESGGLAAYWNAASTGAGRILATGNGAPHDGNYHLTMDSARSGTYSLNELVLTVDLAGRKGVMLNFYHKEFRDEDHSLADIFVESSQGDGVAISSDGRRWYKVQGLTGSEGIASDWRRYEVDLDAAAGAAGIAYNSAFKIKFQQYDNYPISTDGFAFDDIEVYQRMVDSDGDDLPDDWERAYLGDLGQGPDDDNDADDLTNLAEYQTGTDPGNPDTDGDQMYDGWELQFGLDPMDPADASGDLDGDGLKNLDEFLNGTDPTVANASAAAFPFYEDFENGMLDAHWTAASFGGGRIRITSANGPLGTYHVTMDSASNGSYGLNELVLTIDLTGQSDVVLRFYHKEFRDEDHAMPGSFSNSYNADGVSISADGKTWHRVQGLLGADGIGSDWLQFRVDLDAAAAAAGIDFTNAFKIKFQQYDNYPIGTDGFAFDEIEVAAAPPADPGTGPGQDDLSAQERELVELINQERTKRGLAALQVHDALVAAARRHSADMAQNNFLSHTGSDGSSPWDRMREAGYPLTYAGENIAAGYPTPSGVVDGWMNSQGHRDNMLNPNFCEMGVGYAYGSNSSYGHYWTLTLGCR